MPRFVIHAHDWPTPHFDLMFEDGLSLLTWRLACEPSMNCEISAEQIANHRIEYLDDEGPVSGDRGTVVRWDSGTFDWAERNEGRMTIRLHGLILEAHATWNFTESVWIFR